MMRRIESATFVSRLVSRVVVADGSRRTQGGDGVLEKHVIDSAGLDYHGEPIEVLDATFELRAIHEPDQDGKLLAAHVVEKHILDVRMGGCRLRLTCLRHR